MNLAQLISQISETKYLPSSDDLLEVFFRGPVKERVEANIKLAETCFAVDTPEHLERAQQFVSRAWLLSGYSDKCLKLFIRIHEKTGDIFPIQQAYRQIGLKYAAEKKASMALNFFNLWQNTYANFKRLDKFSYDFEILESIKALAAPNCFSSDQIRDGADNRKTRIAYLCFGVGFANSVMVKIIQLFVAFANKDKFEIAVCIPDTRTNIQSSDIGREQVAKFEESGAGILYAGDAASLDIGLHVMAAELNAWNPDILITCSALADLTHYYFASLFPNLLRVALHQGPPPQFVPPDFNYAIAWTQHPVIDCPIDCELVPLELDLPELSGTKSVDLSGFEIPADAFIISSGGRTQKYQDPSFWRTISEILDSDPKIYFLVVGAEKQGLPFLDEIVPAKIQSRICFAGWRKDYLSFMKAGHVVLDTYPSGGGVVLIDIMALEVPFIAFDNDYGKIYDQTDWSPIREFVQDNSLILDRGDYGRLKSLIREIRKNPNLAKDVARKNYDYIHKHHGSPLRMVQKSEGIFLRLIEQLRQHSVDANVAKKSPVQKYVAPVSETSKQDFALDKGSKQTLDEMSMALENAPFLSKLEEMNIKQWISYLQEQEKNLGEWSGRIAKRENRIASRELKFPDLATYHGIRALMTWMRNIRNLLAGKSKNKN